METTALEEGVFYLLGKWKLELVFRRERRNGSQNITNFNQSVRHSIPPRLKPEANSIFHVPSIPPTLNPTRLFARKP